MSVTDVLSTLHADEYPAMQRITTSTWTTEDYDDDVASGLCLAYRRIAKIRNLSTITCVSAGTRYLMAAIENDD